MNQHSREQERKEGESLRSSVRGILSELVKCHKNMESLGKSVSLQNKTSSRDVEEELMNMALYKDKDLVILYGNILICNIKYISKVLGCFHI